MMPEKYSAFLHPVGVVCDVHKTTTIQHLQKHQSLCNNYFLTNRELPHRLIDSWSVRSLAEGNQFIQSARIHLAEKPSEHSMCDDRTVVIPAQVYE